MRETVSEDTSIGPYRGMIALDHESPDLSAWIETVGASVDSASARVIADGRNRNVLLEAPCKGGCRQVVVKSFGKQGWIADRISQGRGSKARRTWLCSQYLHDAGVGTPEPVCFFERWSGGVLRESYFVSEYCESTFSFKEELIRLFRHDPECEKLMELLRVVAEAIREMHDAGFVHYDLGNQNILMSRTGDASWSNVQFIDLNRGRCPGSVTVRQRARDISRIYLPSDFLRVFIEMYWKDVPSREFLQMESRYRRRYALHAATRHIRHPLRYRNKASEPESTRYPSAENTWIWDERSGQPLITMVSKDRRRLYPASRHFWQLASSIRHIRPVYRAYRELLSVCYGNSVGTSKRIAVAVSGREDRFVNERELLQELGCIPVHLRFCFHEGEDQWDAQVKCVRQLSDEGRPVSISLVQSRSAVLDSERWAHFCSHVLDRVAGIVDWVEVCHAVNRVKWGVWGLDEYRRLLAPIANLAAKYPNVVLTGPAVIDFEYYFTLAALDNVPGSMQYGALSHHLYVDRRGAPENYQGRFSSLEKFALARAIARISSKCDDKLIVSEVNWPLKGTGVYSPVGAPYESPGVRTNDPSVSEDEYADYMLRYMLIAICSGMVERVVWWQLVAHGYGIVDDMPGGGLRKRPAFYALKTFLSWAGDACFREKLHTPSGLHVFRFERKEGPDFCVAYCENGQADWVPGFNVGSIVDSLGNELEEDRLHGDAIGLTGRPVFFDVL